MSDDDLGNEVPEDETSEAVVDRRGAAPDADAGAEEPAERELAAEGTNAAPDEPLAAEPAAEKQAKKAGGRSVFHGVPIEVTVSVGKARPTVSDLVELRRDSVLELDSSVNDPVELYIADRLIARGELQEIGEEGNRLGVRLTEVADFSNDM